MNNQMDTFVKPVKEIMELNVKMMQSFSYISPVEVFNARKPEDMMEKNMNAFIKNTQNAYEYMHNVFTIMEKNWFMTSGTKSDFQKNEIQVTPKTTKNAPKRPLAAKTTTSAPKKTTTAKTTTSTPKKALAAKTTTSTPKKALAAKATISSPKKATFSKTSTPKKALAAKATISSPKKATFSKTSTPKKALAVKTTTSAPKKATFSKTTTSTPKKAIVAKTVRSAPKKLVNNGVTKSISTGSINKTGTPVKPTTHQMDRMDVNKHMFHKPMSQSSKDVTNGGKL